MLLQRRLNIKKWSFYRRLLHLSYYNQSLLFIPDGGRSSVYLVFLRCTCGESVNIRIYTAGYNSAPLLSALFSSSCLWLVPVSALGIFLSPVLLITLFHPPFPFLHYEILISSSLSFGHGLWIMHLSLSRPPFTNKVSVSITSSSTRQSEKIW